MQVLDQKLSEAARRRGWPVKKTAHGAWKARRKQQLAKEQSHVIEKEDCSTALFANEDERLFWEDMEKDRALQAKWDQEDKERQERPRKKNDKRTWITNENEQTANEYYKLYGMFTS